MVTQQIWKPIILDIYAENTGGQQVRETCHVSHPFRYSQIATFV